jgi:hypothetical protein
VDFTPDGGTAVPMELTRYEVSAFQIRARFHLWHFQAFAQAGLDFMMLVGQPMDGSGAQAMKAYSLGLSGRAALRAFPFKGLFVEVGFGGRYNLPLPIGQVPWQQGLLGGIGYAF